MSWMALSYSKKNILENDHFGYISETVAMAMHIKILTTIRNYKKTKEESKKTNLEVVFDCVKLPNRFLSGLVPSFEIPQNGTIKSKPIHFNIKSLKLPI